MKKVYLIFALILITGTMQAVMINNQFGAEVLVTIDDDTGHFYCVLLPGKQRDIGTSVNLLNMSVGIWPVPGRDSSNPDFSLIAEFGRENGISTSLPYEQLPELKKFLQSSPNSMIKIIKDPTKPDRPKLVLPFVKNGKK
jgi:hypothetical protein